MLMPPDDDVARLWPMGFIDLDQVFEIDQATQPSPWSKDLLRDCLKVKFDAWVIRSGDDVHAFAIFSVKGEETHLFNLCTKPSSQKKGYGRRLIDKTIKVTREKGGKRISLEVRKSNDVAIKLYGTYGFQQTDEKKDYYDNKDGSKEDAWVLTLELSDVE